MGRDERAYLTQSGVLERSGWTRKALEKFLGDPDRTRSNPYRRTGPRVKHYLLERVLEVEASAAWQEWLAASDRRRAGAQRAAMARADSLLSEMLELISRARLSGRLTPDRMPLGELLKLASASRRDQDAPAVRDLFNALRHKLTDYDDVRRALGLKPTTVSSERESAYEVLRAAVREEILGVYPELADLDVSAPASVAVSATDTPSETER